MNILILGDVMGAAGRKALNNKLPKLIEKKKYKLCNCKR
jgi:calcineurin-like phosphoesterase